MPGGYLDKDEDLEFQANTGDKDVKPVSDSYAGKGQTRDLFSIGRKGCFLGCVLPLFGGFSCALLGLGLLGYDWITHTLENGVTPDTLGWGIGIGVFYLALLLIVILAVLSWLRSRGHRPRRRTR